MRHPVTARSEKFARDLAAVYATEGARRTGSIVPSRALRSLSGLGCCTSCTASRLGSLGVSAPGTTPTGQIVGAGVSIAAGAAATSAIAAGVTAAAGAAAGAAVGSVVPVVGTIVGAVVGWLTTKLFGSADYSAIYSTIENRQTLAEAYIQVAGQYPGRVYGWQEILYIFNGLVVYGIFPENFNLDGSLGKNPPLGSCKNTGSMGYACGEESWVQDVYSGTGERAIPTVTAVANKAGVFNPEQVYDQYYAPLWNGTTPAGTVPWFWPQNVRPGYAGLVEQFYIDAIDALEYSHNASLPCYYGTIPSGSAAGPAGPCGVAAIAPALSPSIAPAGPAPVIPAAATPAAPALSSIGSELSATAASGGALVTSAGTWTFGGASDSAGDYEILLNGSSAAAGGGAGTTLLISPSGALWVQNAAGAVYQWTGSGWTLIEQAPPPAGYTEVGTDSSGNPVYENADGALYEWDGTSMSLFDGTMASGELSTQLQAAIQADLAEGMSLEQATQAALANLAQSGTALTPEVTSGIEQAVQSTYAAAPVVDYSPAAPAAVPPASSSTSDWVYVGLAALGAGALWYAFAHQRARR